MAEFAIGSLASMANYNLHASIPGTVPILGYNLSVHWEFIITLAVLIIGVHSLLVSLILFLARPIVVPADSNLVVARLLHGYVGRFGERGSLLEAKEIAEAIEKDGQEAGEMVGNGKGTVGYGVRQGGHGMVLEVGDGLIKRKGLRGGRFPQGLYA